jgi:hypothetical protein
MRKSTKIVAAVGGAALVVATAGTAYAYWTTNGTGSGNAATASSTPAVSLTATLPASLVPGAGGAVSFAATNPSSTTDAYVTTLKVTSITVVKDVNNTATGGCTAADFDVYSSSSSSTSIVGTDITEGKVIPAGGASTSLPNGAYLKFINGASNQDGCKGATVTLNLTSA